MNTLDLTSALARLLSDGTLRDKFAIDAAGVADRLGVRTADRPAFEKLSAADIEFQAQILIRKRLDAVKQLIPVTCANLRAGLGPHFHQYARLSWLAAENTALPDALAFCQFLQQREPQGINAFERYRATFAANKSPLSMRLTRRPALHILVRRRCGCVREFALYLGWRQPRQG